MTIRIRYHGYSEDLSHPGDRRRIGILQKDKNFEIVAPNTGKYDITLLSSNANFSRYITSESNSPVVIDLIDGYLAQKDKVLQDYARNFLRSFNGKSRYSDLKYSCHIKRYLSLADGCVVPSIEIKNQAIQFSKNIDIILDNHAELLPIRYNPKSSGILWEGFGSNLKHLRECSEDLAKILNEFDMTLYVVSEESFFRFGNKIGKKETSEYLKELFPSVHHRVKLQMWNVDNLRATAEECKLAIIPINAGDAFGRSKCENKLLAMWTLGLPTLTSDTPAYKRVMKEASQEDSSVTSRGWKSALTKALGNQEILVNMRRSGVNYVLENHQEGQLIQKWRAAITSYLE
jgi:hypothetical protein